MVRYPFSPASPHGNTVQHVTPGGLHGNTLQHMPSGGGMMINRMYALSMIGQQLRMLQNSNIYGASNRSNPTYTDTLSNN